MKRRVIDWVVIALFVAFCFVVVVACEPSTRRRSSECTTDCVFRRASNEACVCHCAAAAPDWECGA
jgi:hypothetical protein